MTKNNTEKNLLELYKEQIIKRFEYSGATQKNIEKVLAFQKVIDSKNKILRKMKDNSDFQANITQIREKYEFDKKIHKINRIDSGSGTKNSNGESIFHPDVTYGDYYYNIYRFNFDYISSLKDETMEKIKICIRDLSKNTIGRSDVNVSSQEYIIIVYYIFFNDLISYDNFIKILIHNEGLLLLGPKIELYNDDTKDLELILRDINEEGYHVNRINRFEKLVNRDENQDIINIFRKELNLNTNSSIENHYHNYVNYYNYLRKYYQYSRKEDFFDVSIIQIMERSKVFDYRNELDYLCVLNYLIYGRELDVDVNKEELTFMIPDAWSGYDLIHNNSIELDSCYVKLPIFTSYSYLEEVRSILNSLVTDIYNLPKGKDRNNNSYMEYRHNKIYKTYLDYVNNGYKHGQAINQTIKDINEKNPGSIAYKMGKDGFGEVSEYEQIERIVKYKKRKMKG